MNNTKYPLNYLFAEIETKITTLSLLDRDHELTLYNAKSLALGENSRLLVRFMKRFCIGVENPAMPNQYELFTALQAYVTALDDAILTNLLESVGVVLSKGFTFKEPGFHQVTMAYKAFLRSLESIELARQSTLHIGRS